MTDYIFEIQCYEKGNLLKEFAEYCGYKLGFYYYYDNHAVVDFIKPEESNLLIQQPIQFEIYAFYVKLSPTTHNNSKTRLACHQVKGNWISFLSRKFPNYKKDLENWVHRDRFCL